MKFLLIILRDIPSRALKFLKLIGLPRLTRINICKMGIFKGSIAPPSKELLELKTLNWDPSEIRFMVLLDIFK